MNAVSPIERSSSKAKRKTPTQHDVVGLKPGLRAVLDALDDYVRPLGNDVRVEDVQEYRGYWRGNRFCVVQALKTQLTVYLRVERSVGEEILSSGPFADMARFNPDGDVRVVLKSLDDLNTAKPAIARAYAAIASSVLAGREAA